MGRTRPHKPINRNNNKIQNPVTTFGAVWLNSDGDPIEDSSSGNKSTSPESPRRQHPWNYTHASLFPPASGDHSTRPRKQTNFGHSSTLGQERGDCIEDYVYNELFGDRGNKPSEEDIRRDFVSMLNRHYQLSPDSYTESDLSEPAVPERKDTPENYSWFKSGVRSPENFDLEKENCDDNILIFNQHSGPDHNTFWMYTSSSSNQCKTRADKDCNLDLQIPNSSSSDSKDSTKEVPLKNMETRVPTPTPPSFISKYSLPLMATLPTVAEIKTPINRSPSLQRKAINSWFDTRERESIDCKTCFSAPLTAKETRQQLKLRSKKTQASQANFMLATVKENISKQSTSTQTDIKMNFFIDLKQTTPVIDSKAVNKESNDTYVIAVADADVTATPAALKFIKTKAENNLNANSFCPSQQETAADAIDIINWNDEGKTDSNVAANEKDLVEAKNDTDRINETNKVAKCVSWPRDKTHNDSDDSGPVDFQATFRSTGDDNNKKRRVFIRAGPWGDFSSIVDSPHSLHISLSETTSFEGNLTWWRRMFNCFVCK